MKKNTIIPKMIILELPPPSLELFGWCRETPEGTAGSVRERERERGEAEAEAFGGRVPRGGA